MSDNNINTAARGLSSTLVYAKRLKGAQSRGGAIGAAFQTSWNPNFAAIISFALTVGNDLKQVQLGQLVIAPEDVGGAVDQAAVSAEFGQEVAQMVHAYMLEDGKVREELTRDDLAYLATLDYSGLLAKVYSQIQSEIPRNDTAGSEFRSHLAVGDTTLLSPTSFLDTSKVPGASAVSRPSAVQAHADAGRELGHGTAELPGATGHVAAGAADNTKTASADQLSSKRGESGVFIPQEETPPVQNNYGLGGDAGSVNVQADQGKGPGNLPEHKPTDGVQGDDSVPTERRDNDISHDPERRAATTPPETAELPGNHPEDKADGADTPDPVTGDVPSK